MSRRRRPVRPGDAVKAMEHNAKIRSQIADERAKHAAKLVDLNDRAREAHLLADVELRSVRLERIGHQRAEEDRRHKIATEKLNGRLKR